jgi:hypothetical protein
MRPRHKWLTPLEIAEPAEGSPDLYPDQPELKHSSFGNIYKIFIGIIPRYWSLNLASLPTVYIIDGLLPSPYPRVVQEAVCWCCCNHCDLYPIYHSSHGSTWSSCSPSVQGPPTQWNDGETAALVDYLYDHCSEAEGAGNFKQQVLSSAAEYINNHEALQSTCANPLKTAKSTRNKWTSVCPNWSDLT